MADEHVKIDETYKFVNRSRVAGNRLRSLELACSTYAPHQNAKVEEVTINILNRAKDFANFLESGDDQKTS